MTALAIAMLLIVLAVIVMRYVITRQADDDWEKLHGKPKDRK